jgi:hypothetical protein
MISNLRIAALAAVCATLLAVAPAASAADEPSIAIAPTFTNEPVIGITPGFRSAAASTTFLANFTFDSGPNCVDESWVSADLTAGTEDFGDYAALYPGLSIVQVDPCAIELDCVWTFFTGSTVDYACGGWPGQSSVPYGSAQKGYIHNEVQSPAIALAGSGSQCEMGFDVYRELDLDYLVFYTWRVRSVVSGVPGEWSDRNTIYYGPNAVSGTGDWYRQVVSFGDLIDPGADSIQVALGVVDMSGDWCGVLGDGLCHSHTPLFDDVELYRVDVSGPRWHVDPVDLFQDNFPTDGTGTGTVRVDIARDILPRKSPSILPGDSLVAWVGEPTVGLDYHSAGIPSSGPAVYLCVRDVSPAKSGAAISDEAARWPVVATSGGWTTVQMDSVRTPADVLSGRFCVDLDDELYEAGDTIEFYLSARDAGGATTYWTENTRTTFAQSEVQNNPMEMTCLPAGGPGRGGDILYIDDDDGHGSQIYFTTAFEMMGIAHQVDRFDVRGPDRLAGNGLGSRVVDAALQLTPYYRKIIWCSGSLPHGLVGDGTGQPEKSPDAQVLAAFLRGAERYGGLYLTGDQLAGELEGLSSAGATDLKAFIDYTVSSRSHVTSLGISPLGVGEPGSMFSDVFGPDTLVTYGGCPIIKSFDVLTPQGDAQLEMQYHGYSRTGGAVVSQKTTNPNSINQGVVLSGFSYDRIREYGSQAIPARAEHLYRVLFWLNYEPPPPCGVSMVRAERVDDGVNVTWSFDTNCYAFQAFRVTRNVADKEEIIGETDATAREFLDESPVVGTWSLYTVAGQHEDGSWRELDSWMMAVEAIINDFAATAEDFGIRITWRMEPASGVVGFEIHREEEGENGVTKVHSALLDPDTRSFLDKDVTPGTTYNYHMAVVYTDLGVYTGVEATATARYPHYLAQNAPNPFNPTTKIGYSIPSPTHVELIVFDVGGRKVATLVDGVVSPAGYHEVEWAGTRDNGNAVASGVYFYRMTAVGKTFSKKLVIVR